MAMLSSALHTHRGSAGAAALAACLAALSCSNDSTAPAGAACEPETASVTATVTVGATVTFDWQPRCAVALVLVEQDASDQWGIITDEDTWSSPDAANRITPPVAYGATPAETTTLEPPAALVAGQTYELVLWRVLPAGSTAQCLNRFENVCLLVVHQFTR